MGYYIVYYLKKFWYIPTLIVVICLAWFILSINNVDIIPSFEKYENKVSFEPDKYVEEDVNAEEYLKDIEVGAPYLGKLSTPYVPPSIKNSAEEDKYLRELAKNPDLVYYKGISWASGAITNNQLNELVELVGYHLNKNSNDVSILVSVPTIEQLKEYKQDLIYQTDKDGTLLLNIYVEEIDELKNSKKSYCFTYKLKYDMEGKITIR